MGNGTNAVPLCAPRVQDNPMIGSRLIAYSRVLVVALLASSCAQERSPTAPGTTGTELTPPSPDSIGTTTNGDWIEIPPSSAPNGKAVKGVRWNASRELVELSVVGKIGPSGGSLSIPGSDFTIYFPEGALSSPTTITIVSKESPWVTYDMLPHGLVFAKPVYAMQGMVNTTAYGTPAAYAVFGAYLETGKEEVSAENIANAAETTQSFIFQGRSRTPTWSVWVLHHFSRYMLASG